MKRRLSVLILIVSTIFFAITLIACDDNGGDNPHTHAYGEWQTKLESTCTEKGRRERSCSCGDIQSEDLPAKGHTLSLVPEVSATCSKTGISEHKKCNDCNYTEGKTVLSKKAHRYTETIMEEATCIEIGTKKLSCINCTHFRIEEYSLPSYTADEIYNMAKKTVGEIITYDKQGNEHSLGTGVLYTDDGQVITNYHVIEDAYSAKITIGGIEYKVEKVLAYDKDIDLAVLKISISGVKALKFCENRVTVGKTVYALGSSKGLTATFSQGIITYAARQIDGVTYIQHDAAISSGNSGGPLINEFCEVVGINTMTVKDSQNLNFAIFTSEIDELDFDKPLTMAQLYEKEYNPFKKMVNYIVANGEYDSENNEYYLVLGTAVDSGTTTQYVRIAYYAVESNEIGLLLYSESDNLSFLFGIKIGELNGSYAYAYVDNYQIEMTGTIKASTFRESTTLGYSYTNCPSAYVSDYKSLVSASAKYLISAFNDDFANIGVTAEELGFIYW